MTPELTPRVAVIMPVYNRGELIKASIQSVLDQTLTDWELIIVDDCSTDHSREVISSYTDARIKPLFLNKNGERGAARNAGIDYATAPLIAFLDSDDRFLPHHLETLVAAWENHGKQDAMYFTNSYLENEQGEQTEKQVPLLQNHNVFAYLLHWTPNPARVAVSRPVFNHFRYDITIPGLEDFDLWLHIATQFPVIHIPQYTNIYFVHAASYTLGDQKRFEKELKNFAYIFNKQTLANRLPGHKTRRLLSMCHYHLAVKANLDQRRMDVFRHGLASYFLYPASYNGRTNKPLAVMLMYNIPVLGSTLKWIRRIIK